jgi:drug/metabolite transporter (DMT)-like permease
MNRPVLKFWVIGTVTLAVAALMMRLVWETRTAIAPGTWAILILLMLAALGLLIASIYLTINPDIKKLQSPPFKIGISAILVAVGISGIIHFYRFIPSPEANIPVSIPMATLLLISVLSACTLFLYILWRRKD